MSMSDWAKREGLSITDGGKAMLDNDLISKNALIKVIYNFQTVNAVSVVRCKDCMHKPNNLGAIVENYEIEFPDDVCPLQCSDHWYNKMPTAEWFCASGEAKDGGGDDAEQ